MTIQAQGETEASPFAQWFFKGDSIRGDLPEPLWTPEEIAVISTAMTACLEAWQARQGHLWSSNFWHITKQDRSDGPFYLARKTLWRDSHLSGQSPEALADEIQNCFR